MLARFYFCVWLVAVVWPTRDDRVKRAGLALVVGESKRTHDRVLAAFVSTIFFCFAAASLPRVIMPFAVEKGLTRRVYHRFPLHDLDRSEKIGS